MSSRQAGGDLTDQNSFPDDDQVNPLRPQTYPDGAVTKAECLEVLCDRHDRRKSLWNPFDAVWTYLRNLKQQRLSSGAHEMRHANERSADEDDDFGRISRAEDLAPDEPPVEEYHDDDD